MRRHIRQRIVAGACLLALGWGTWDPAVGGQGSPQGQGDASTLGSGKAALEDGFYEMALERFEAYVRDSGDEGAKVRGTLLIGQSLYGLKRYEEGIARLREWRARARHADLEGACVFWLASGYRALGQDAQVLELLAGFADAFPGSPQAAAAERLRAETLVCLARYDEALEIYHHLAEAHPEAAGAEAFLMEQAALLESCGRIVEAIGVLEHLAAAYPEGPDAAEGRLRLGALYIAIGQLDDAIETYRPLTEMAEGPGAALSSAAWFGLAEAERLRGDLARADAALEEAIRRSNHPGEQARGYVERGRIRVQLGDVEEGLGLLRKAVLTHPDPAAAAETQLLYAGLLQGEGLHDRAIDAYQEYLEAFSEYGKEDEALWGKGWSLWEGGRYAEAAGVFEKVADACADPDRLAQALLKVADSRFAEQQFQAASRVYRQFIDTYPVHALRPQALLQEAEALARAGDLSEAEARLKEIIAGAPGAGLARDAALRKAILLEETGRFEEAEADYSVLIDRYPESAQAGEAVHRRGIVRYHRLRRFDEALADFRRVAAESPESSLAMEARYMQGWCLYLLERDEEALAVSREFIAAYPDSSLAGRVRFWLGEYHWNHTDYAAAEEQFLALAELDPQAELADKALYWAARSAEKQSDFVRANDHATKLIRAHPESSLMPEIRLLQGDALRELGEFSGAINAYNEIIEKWPTSYLVDRAWGCKGDCQFTLGTGGTNDVAEQKARLEQALSSYRTVAESATATTALKLQATFKTGRCLEKMARTEEAVEQYLQVVYGYLGEWSAGGVPEEVWFTRAAFAAAEILEKQGEDGWREAIRIYQRVVDAGVRSAPDARKLMQKIRLEHWMPF